MLNLLGKVAELQKKHLSGQVSNSNSRNRWQNHSFRCHLDDFNELLDSQLQKDKIKNGELFLNKDRKVDERF